MQPSATLGMQRFEVKTYDATNYIESGCILLWCPFLGWTKKTLILDEEEAVLKTDNNCCHSTQARRRPRPRFYRPCSMD